MTTIVTRTIIALTLAVGLCFAAGFGSSSTTKPAITHQSRESLYAKNALFYLKHDERMLRAKSLPATPANVKSYNWGGYAEGYGPSSLGTFTAVSGSWTIPHVTCPTAGTRGVGAENLIVADWVGLDGLSSSTVEQLGSMSQCYEGVASYLVWWEMYPSGSANVSFAEAGDAIHASVTVNAAGNYVLALTDVQDPEASFKTTQPCIGQGICQDNSAEWVVERPAYQIGLIPEADYGKTTFTDASSTPTNAKYRFTTYRIWTVDATDSYLLAGVSPLVAERFTSTWRNSY